MRFFTAKKIAGSGALLLAVTLLIQPWEGNELKPYLDVGGVPTVCAGVTGEDVIMGKVYTKQECEKLNEKHAAIHAVSVNRLVTYRPISDKTMASFISFHYNVGAGAFAESTLLKKANAGDLIGACNELSRWVFVKGVKVKGLENRRISERALCLEGL